MYVPARTVTGPSFLAQTSLSRLGEISSNSPRLLVWVVAQAASSCLSESPSRSGEEVSLKQEGTTVPLFLIRALA